MAINVQFTPASEGNSFYSFIDNVCLQKLNGHSRNISLHRLCNLMRKMGVRTVITEELTPDHAKIKEEADALGQYYNKSVEIKAWRLTFLSSAITSPDELPSQSNNKFLSSAILVNFKDEKDLWHSYILSAIVAVPRIAKHEKYADLPLLNNYLHIKKSFQCEIDLEEGKTHKFEIAGTYFCQQNSVTYVCAHATLCMVINNLTVPGLNFISPQDINKILGVDHKTKRFGPGKDGLGVKEIDTVLVKMGLSSHKMDFFLQPNMDYCEFIYRYIESGCPVILGFNTNREAHVVPILGHTLNTDIWRPEAESVYSNIVRNRLDYYTSSSKWVDHFIMHDDNFGMFYCMPVDALRRITLPKHDPTFRAHAAVAVVPPDVKRSAWEAEYSSKINVEDFITKHFQNKTIDIWSNRLISSNRPMVVRTFLVTKQDYLDSLDRPDFEGNSFSEENKNELCSDLPTRFWLTEITNPDLYTANSSKIIDVFYGCDQPEPKNNKDIIGRWIQMRFPLALIKNKSPVIVTKELNVKSHLPLLRFKSDQDTLEW